MEIQCVSCKVRTEILKIFSWILGSKGLSVMDMFKRFTILGSERDLKNKMKIFVLIGGIIYMEK
jgi:hypothetical protein